METTDVKKLLDNLTLNEFNEANLLYDELLNHGVDIPRAIGAVYRYAYRQSHADARERRKAFHMARMEREALMEAISVIPEEELIEVAGGHDHE